MMVLAGGWFRMHSRNFSLVTTVNHFVNDCPNLNLLPSFLLHRSSLEVRVKLFYLRFVISTLEIALANIPLDVLVLKSTLAIVLANILRDALVLFDVADVHQCNKVDFPYLLFCVPSLWPPFIPFPLSPLHLESTLLGMKDLLFVLLGFPRHASLRDRSPESSEPYITLDFSKFAEQNNIQSSYFFLPRFSLESLLYSPDFSCLLEEFCLTDTLCHETRQNVLAITFKES